MAFRDSTRSRRQSIFGGSFALLIPSAPEPSAFFPSLFGSGGGSDCVGVVVSSPMADRTDRITIDPDICNGKPVVRGLRITVETILDYLSAGETPEEILRQHPMLEPEDIPACLAFASRLMSRNYIVKETA